MFFLLFLSNLISFDYLQCVVFPSRFSLDKKDFRKRAFPDDRKEKKVIEGEVLFIFGFHVVVNSLLCSERLANKLSSFCYSDVSSSSFQFESLNNRSLKLTLNAY